MTWLAVFPSRGNRKAIYKKIQFLHLLATFFPFRQCVLLLSPFQSHLISYLEVQKNLTANITRLDSNQGGKSVTALLFCPPAPHQAAAAIYIIACTHSKHSFQILLCLKGDNHFLASSSTSKIAVSSSQHK